MEELKIKFDKKEIEAKPRKLSSTLSIDTVQDITAFHDIDSIWFKRIEQELFDKEMSEKLDALGF